MENNTLAHLEALRQDARDEIKRRIEQRDKYSIQSTVALAALIVVAFSTPSYGQTNLDLRMVLLAVPLVLIYFTVLILYSYRVHDVLANYLRHRIEPELAKLCNIDVSNEWENYYYKCQIPGIRGPFFYWAPLILSALPLIYLFLDKPDDINYIVLIVPTLLYFGVYLFIGIYFHKEIFKKGPKKDDEGLATKT
ncbi:hypothetical protein ACFLW8_03855 [Chloroflexota bacterium]